VQVGRTSSTEFEVDPERFFLDYRHTQALNLQFGLYFTPVGYFNRFLYSRAWLMNSVAIPDLFEEEVNLVPTHTTGINVHGTTDLGAGHQLGYIVGVGNGRGATPLDIYYARDPQPNLEVTALVEWLIPGFKESRVGLSGWVDHGFESVYIPEVGGTAPADGPTMRLTEVGANPYMVVNERRFGLLAEYVFSRRIDLLGNLPEPAYDLHGLVTEVSLNVVDRKLHPYVRYDINAFPEGGDPYLTVRQDDAGGFYRVEVPSTHAVMVGAAYDLSPNLRVKGDYAHHLAGPRPMHRVAAQLAFGF
jgi:hypothetical protein